MVEMKVDVIEPHPPQDRIKTILFERALQFKENAQIYPCTPLGNKSLQQYIALVEVIRLCGFYSEFQDKGGSV